MKEKFLILSLIVHLTSGTPMHNNCLAIGHRGACGYAPENTLASFKKALELGVDMVEFDVYLCKSGEVVVIHDDTVDRTTNGTGFINDLTLKQLKQLDIDNGEKVPTLQEVLDCIDRKCIVNIELKGPHTALPVAKIIHEYITHKGWQYKDFLISSFDHQQLAVTKSIDPNLRIGLLLHALSVHLPHIGQQFGAYSLHVNSESTTQEFVDDTHKSGLKFFVYTVNNPEEIAYIKSLGVDGIFSDYPDRIV